MMHSVFKENGSIVDIANSWYAKHIDINLFFTNSLLFFRATKAIVQFSKDASFFRELKGHYHDVAHTQTWLVSFSRKQ